MARARKPKPSARSARTARDNARARALGYRDYYDFRLHENGRLPPEAPLPPRGQRSRARGHRGISDFLSQLRPGDILVVPNGLGAIEKDAKGRFVRVDKMVIDGETGRAEMFTFRRLTVERMARLIEQENDRGAVWSPSPSLDQRRLLNMGERPATDQPESSSRRRGADGE